MQVRKNLQIRTRKRQFLAALHYGYTRMALNYYMYYEISMEDSFMSRRLAPLEAGYHGLLEGFLRDGMNPAALDLDALDRLRNQVKAQVEILTAYTDIFQAYEYVLNRLEGNFSPQLMGKRSNISHEDMMTLEIMNYITESYEAPVVNERIRSIIGQLPVRFTKEKFFSLVERGLSVYQGGPKESLDDMFYVLRCEALVNRPKDMEAGYGPLYSVLLELEEADYKNLSAETYHHLEAELKKAGCFLADGTGRLTLLMDLVNDLYVLFLSRKHAMMEVSEEQRLKEILGGVLDLFKNGNKEPIPGEVTDKLSRLEGKQESYYEQWMNDSLSLEEPGAAGQEDGEAKALRKVELLLSGSSFMSLDGPGPAGQKAVDQAMLREETDLFFEEFTRAFDGKSRLLVRAVMAKVLSSLPVFFETLDEVEKYIRSSLQSCSDDIEKAITMKLIREMMREDGFESGETS